MFQFNEERLYIAPFKDISTYDAKNNIHNLTHINVERSLIRLLFRTFSRANGSNYLAGINSNELQYFYELAKPLGVDMKFMNPDNNDVGKRSFIEGNLFTFTGNGVSAKEDDPKDFLTFTEMEELLSIMWSGGQLRNQFYDSALKACRRDNILDGPLDHVNMIKINRECFFSHFTDNYFSEFSNLPNMLRVLQSNMSESDCSFGAPLGSSFRCGSDKFKLSDNLIKMMQNLQVIAMPTVNPSLKYLDFSEIATMVTVLHYVEVLFAVYDTDKNDVLKFDEFMKAFGRFNGYIARQVKAMTCKDEELGLLKAVFAFIINYQRLPVTDNSMEGISDKATLWAYQHYYFSDDKEIVAKTDPESIDIPNDDKADINATALLPTNTAIDRFGILNVLKVLAQAGRNPAQKCQPMH